MKGHICVVILLCLSVFSLSPQAGWGSDVYAVKRGGMGGSSASGGSAGTELLETGSASVVPFLTPGFFGSAEFGWYTRGSLLLGGMVEGGLFTHGLAGRNEDNSIRETRTFSFHYMFTGVFIGMDSKQQGAFWGSRLVPGLLFATGGEKEVRSRDLRVAYNLPDGSVAAVNLRIDIEALYALPLGEGHLLLSARGSYTNLRCGSSLNTDGDVLHTGSAALAIGYRWGGGK